MKEKPKDESAYIIENEHCKECGWPIVHTCCNDEMHDFAEQETGELWDWWLYCSNKGCKNHKGEGVFQNWPEWAEENEA